MADDSEMHPMLSECCVKCERERKSEGEKDRNRTNGMDQVGEGLHSNKNLLIRRIEMVDLMRSFGSFVLCLACVNSLYELSSQLFAHVIPNVLFPSIQLSNQTKSNAMRVSAFAQCTHFTSI